MAWSDTRGDWSQREQRRGAILTDQHGRKYSAVIEKKTGDDLFWQAMYTAPLIPPAMYFEPHPDVDRPNDRVINYTRWKEDIRRDTDAWELLGRTIVRQIPNGLNADGSFSLAVLDQIGPKPTPIEPVIAAEQGNKWVLGFTQVPDPRLKKFFEVLQVVKKYDEPDFSGDPEDEDDGFAGLDEEHDVEAMGGKRVRPGKPAPGQKPDGASRKQTQQAHGVKRSSGTAEAPPKPQRSHHKKKDTAPVQEPDLAGSPS